MKTTVTIKKETKAYFVTDMTVLSTNHSEEKCYIKVNTQ